MEDGNGGKKMEDSNGDEKLIWALKAGDMDEVKKKVLTCDDANRTLGTSGRKPLHFAADFGNEDMLEFLISIGADINMKDKHGFTPLITACYEGHLACVKLLLEKGANKDLKGDNEVTAFDAAEKEEIKSLLK